MQLVILVDITHELIPVLLYHCHQIFIIIAIKCEKCCIIPRPILNPISTLLLKTVLDLLCWLYNRIETNIIKHNSHNKYFEDFSDIYIFLILQPTIFEIYTLNENTNHVGVIFLIGFITIIEKTFNMYYKSLLLGCSLVFLDSCVI